MIAKVSNAGVESPFNIDGGFTSFKYVEISLMVLISDLVLSYLKPHLPKNWQIKNLQSLSEDSTYELLKKSKIFLSFSSLEGLGLPPAEAALAGNMVVGYTGEGGNEYWQEPLLTKINSGDIKKFVLKIIEKISKDDAKKNYKKRNYRKIERIFSKENELKNIKKFIKSI